METLAPSFSPLYTQFFPFSSPTELLVHVVVKAIGAGPEISPTQQILQNKSVCASSETYKLYLQWALNWSCPQELNF